MCGIAGFIGLDKSTPRKKNIDKCKSLLFRRGPDSNGTYKEKIRNKEILFVHTRLSIIDLNKNSDQPFQDENGVLIFNGMIYNYLELKKNLKKKGIKFKTNSDTEVLLKILNIYKEKAFKMLDGMWALAYFNFKTKDVILSRDRLGEKPLYYKNDNGNLFFSNSIAALSALNKKKLEFNKEKVKSLLMYPDKVYGINNQTIFKNIYQFPSGTFLKFNLIKSKNFLFKDYWDLKVGNSQISFKKACINIRKIISQVTKTRVRSHVKNSVLISGGLDSNTIVSQAKKISKINGYSLISTNPKYDESKKIKISARSNNFSVKYISSKANNSLKILEKIINNSFNVLLTPTALALALLCNKIKRDGNKVLLTGIGGDELFCGYYINYLAHINSYKGHRKFEEKYHFWKNKIKKYIRNNNLKDLKKSYKIQNRYKLNLYTEGDTILKKYINEPPKIKIKKFSNDIFYNNMMQNIFQQSIPVQLLQNDLVTMFFSIESRSPFLSHNLFQYIFNLDKDYFMKKGQPKSLLRNSMKKYFPKIIYDDYEKTGFYSPFKSFFNKNNMKKIKFYLKKSKILRKNLKTKEFTNLIKKKDKKITHEESKFLFICLNIAILEKNIIKNNR